jgi:hypothetical protein
MAGAGEPGKSSFWNWNLDLTSATLIKGSRFMVNQKVVLIYLLVFNFFSFLYQ